MKIFAGSKESQGKEPKWLAELPFWRTMAGEWRDSRCLSNECGCGLFGYPPLRRLLFLLVVNDHGVCLAVAGEYYDMAALVERGQVGRLILVLAADLDLGVLGDGEGFRVALACGRGLAFLFLVMRFDGDGILLHGDNGAVDAVLPRLFLALIRRFRRPDTHGDNSTQNQAKTAHGFSPVI